MAADQRVVGQAIRRRQGNAMSHLGQAEGEAKRSGFWHPPTGGLAQAESIAGAEESLTEAGGRSMAGGSAHIKGVPDVYETGTATVGRKGGPPLASDNATFASAVGGAREAEPHPTRGRLSEGESTGGRLTVSPSMKVPTESPVPTQGGGIPVPSVPSRRGAFSAGMAEASQG